MVRDNHDDWVAVERICRGMALEVSAIAGTVTESIRRAQPVYSAVIEAEHRRAVAVQMGNRLQALAEQRGLSPSELEAATDLAAERAAEGIPIDALIAAYQAADAEIWRILVERSTPATAPLLPRIGTLMFDAIRETTTVMARAHSRVARAIDGDRITLAHQFLDCVEDPEQRSVASVIATRLGLDPAGSFLGIVWLPDLDDLEPATARTVSALPAHLAADVVSRAVAGGGLEMVTQTQRFPELVAQCLAAGSLSGRWGVGVARAGLTGASASLGDARLAFGATSARHPIRTFARDWHEAVVLAGRARLEVLLASAVEVARSNPHLTETVLAFAAADMSVAATAPAVQVHANSVTYRLERWARLTGLDPRTFAGLSQSVVACRIAESDHERTGREHHAR